MLFFFFLYTPTCSIYCFRVVMLADNILYCYVSLCSSSSTPTVPYTATDLAYNEGNKQGGDLTTTDLVCFDREKEKNRLREFDASNRQHSGKNNVRRSFSSDKSMHSGIISYFLENMLGVFLWQSVWHMCLNYISWV